MKRATVDKDNLIGDPAFYDVTVERLTSKDYAAAMAKDIVARVKADVPRLNTGFASKEEANALCDKLKAAGKTCFVR